MRIPLSAAALILLALPTAACHKPKVVPKDASPAVAKASPTATPAGDETVRNGLPSAQKEGEHLVTAYFDWKSSTLTPDAQSALDQDVAILRSNPDVAVRIEGHCDERGSTQYNMALGQRRAEAARQWVTSKGIDGSRLSVVSYGKERPVDPGHDDAAWAKNRRVEFVVTRGTSRVSSSR